MSISQIIRYKDRKAQISIFVIIGILILSLFGFLFVYEYVTFANNAKKDLRIGDTDEQVQSLKNYIDSCYTDQEKCLLLEISSIEKLRNIDRYEDYSKKLLENNHLQCLEYLPEPVNKPFADKSLNKVKVIMSVEKTSFAYDTKQKVNVGNNTLKDLGKYTQEHNVQFLRLNKHAVNINSSKKVRFDYLKNIPINQKIIKDDNDKIYILNDSISEIEGRQYLVVLKN